MKKDIHPNYYPEAKITCACGNVFTIGSTVESINVEICSACHPYYTGKQKLVDTARRIDKFQKRAEAKATKATGKKVKKERQAITKKAKAAKEK